MQPPIRHRSPWSGIRILAVLAWAVAGPTPVAAQSLGLDLVATRAGYDGVLESPRGVRIYGEVPLATWAGVRLGYAARGEGHVRTGPTCTGLVLPDQPCPVDTMDGKTDLSTASLGLAFYPARWGRVRAEVVASVLSTDVESSFTGRETGRTIRPVTPDGRSRGWAAGGGVHVDLTGPFVAAARIAYEVPNLSSCGADAWFAFCEERNFWSLSLGVAFVGPSRGLEAPP